MKSKSLILVTICFFVSFTTLNAKAIIYAKNPANKDQATKLQMATNRDESKEIKHLTSTVKKTTKTILSLLHKNKDLSNKPNQLYLKMEASLDPVVSFDSMARAVMGRYAHRVTHKEFESFVDVFKKSIVVFYSKLLYQYDVANLTIDDIQPPHKEQLEQYRSGSLLSVPVNMKISDKNNSYQLTYLMMQVNETWKIRNIIVEGINIGIQYKNQFSNAVETYSSPERVILNWNRIMNINTSKHYK